MMELEAEAQAPLPGHYESHLGSIAQSWKAKNSSYRLQIVSFGSQPEAGVTTFATLGLSRFVLKQPSNRDVLQELLVSANDEFSGSEVAGFLLSLAESLITGGRALLRGEVIGPGTPIIPDATARAIYCANPSPFGDSLTMFTSVPPTVFVYLIPITVEEANLVRDHGWQWFESELERQNPDIWDLGRSEMVVCKG